MATGLAFSLVFQMSLCAFIAFAGGFWILSNWFDRKLEAWEAGILLLALLTAMFISIASVFAGGPGLFVLAVVVFGGALLLRTLAAASDRKLGRRLDDEEIAKYQKAISDYPENPYAHTLLADVYRRLGRLEEALQEYELAFQMDPSLQEERRMYEWTRTELERQLSKKMMCPACRAPRQPGTYICPDCQRPYSSLETWVHAFRVMPPHRRAVWAGVGLVVFALAWALILFAPSVMKKVGALMLLALPVVFAIMAARNRRLTG
jgi:tetratricopeptide (TPR) repeat protein